MAKETKQIANETEPESELVHIRFPGVAENIGSELSLDEAEMLIKQRKKTLKEPTQLVEQFEASPWDGAHAFDQVMKRRFGWTQGMKISSFWGDTPPRLHRIETGPNQYAQVPWGRVMLPKGDGGYMELGAQHGAEGVFKFTISATMLKKYEKVVAGIFADVRTELENNSIYRGKAIRIKFTDDSGDALPMPVIQFLDTSKIRVDQLVLSDDLMAMVNASLLWPIARVQDTIANGMRVKRGVLLGGEPGVGKTLIAQVASRVAVDNDVTYIWVEKAADFTRGISFAQQYQKKKDSAAVVSVEDIDRITSGKRDAAMDKLLSDFDGVDSKLWNIIVVATTNDMKSIQKVVKRPGRFDARINILPPDAKAVQKLVRYYGGESIDPRLSLDEVGEVMAGQIPANIEEVVKRAKLMQLGLQERGTKITNISEKALLLAAKLVRGEIEDAAEEPPKPPSLDTAFRGLVQEELAPAIDRLMS